VFYSGTAMEMPDRYSRLHSESACVAGVSIMDIGHSQNLWSLLPLLLTGKSLHYA